MTDSAGRAPPVAAEALSGATGVRSRVSLYKAKSREAEGLRPQKMREDGFLITCNRTTTGS